MFSDRTIALLVPFLVATGQASVIDVPRDDTLDKQPPAQSSVQVLSDGYDCKPGNDWDCYKKYYHEYNYCHPQDTNCYKDCKDWGEYKDHCYHKDYDNKCYDKCHYGKDDCTKWNECHEYDYDCYKKKHENHYDHCDYGDDRCHKDKKPDDHTKDYCKPWDWDCHKKDHKDHDYECNPWKDKSCYPYYYPEPYCPPKEKPKQPHNDIRVYFYSPCDGPCGTNGYSKNIWPDGDEVWTEKDDIIIDHIKYWADKEDEDVRCLPMLSYFPWTPIPLEKYVETYDDYDKKVRVLHLKEPQPIELIRCDFY